MIWNLPIDLIILQTQKRKTVDKQPKKGKGKKGKEKERKETIIQEVHRTMISK